MPLTNYSRSPLQLYASKQYYELTSAAFLHWYVLDHALTSGINSPACYPPGIEVSNIQPVDPFLYPEITLEIQWNNHTRTALVAIQNVMNLFRYTYNDAYMIYNATF